MASYKQDKKTAELAKAFKHQEKCDALATEERKEKLEECKEELDELIKWFEKERDELEIPQMTTIISEQAVVTGGKKVTQTMSIKIIRCSDLLFSIIEHREKIMERIPKAMEFFKDNLNDITKLDDALHLMQFMLQLPGSGLLKRCDPDADHYNNFASKDAQRPKNVCMCPPQQQIASSEGFLTFIMPQEPGSQFKQQLYLAGGIFIIMFFLLFKVWPEWMRLAVWYISWYFLVALIGTAILRVIVWFFIWHFGVDFWIFPNYWADEDAILDSFRPFLSCELSSTMKDPKMWVIRIVSALAICNGLQEFVRDPTKLDMFKDGASDAWNDVFQWGEDKFMGRPDNTTMLQTKKSARQIYAEAFMEDDQGKGFMAGGKRIYDEIDDDPKKKIHKPIDDEAEEESKIENLDEPIKEDDHKAVDMDALLGGDDEADEEEELYEDLDIPENATPIEMPENPEDDRQTEWLKLGYKNGWIDHEKKYHAPEPQKYQKILEGEAGERDHATYMKNIDSDVEKIKAGTYDGHSDNQNEETRHWENTEEDINLFRATKIKNIEKEQAKYKQIAQDLEAELDKARAKAAKRNAKAKAKRAKNNAAVDEKIDQATEERHESTEEDSQKSDL